MSISFIIPFRPKDKVRLNNFNYVKAYIEKTFPGCELIVADSPFASFNRGAAINEGVKQSTGDILVFHDADMLITRDQLDGAITHLHSLVCSYAVPFSSVHYISKEETARVLSGDKIPFIDELDLERKYEAPSRGGINVLFRDKFIPFDTRFCGWGFEDSAFAVCMKTYYGAIKHVFSPALHLYHIDECDSNSLEYKKNAELCRRYEALEGKPEKLRRLINEL